MVIREALDAYRRWDGLLLFFNSGIMTARLVPDIMDTRSVALSNKLARIIWAVGHRMSISP